MKSIINVQNILAKDSLSDLFSGHTAQKKVVVMGIIPHLTSILALGLNYMESLLFGGRRCSAALGAVLHQSKAP